MMWNPAVGHVAQRWLSTWSPYSPLLSWMLWKVDKKQQMIMQLWHIQSSTMDSTTVLTHLHSIIPSLKLIPFTCFTHTPMVKYQHSPQFPAKSCCYLPAFPSSWAPVLDTRALTNQLWNPDYDSCLTLWITTPTIAWPLPASTEPFAWPFQPVCLKSRPWVQPAPCAWVIVTAIH